MTFPDDPHTQASWFSRIRKAHQTETTEDYVELIADLLQHKGEARLVDLAERMGVSQPTVSKIIGRLKEEGFVEGAPYRGLFLTKAGEKLAAHCKERHKIVFEFLVSLGVPKEIAEYDAEGIEHHVSAETLVILKAKSKK